MSNSNIYNIILQKKTNGQKAFSVLVDPDNVSLQKMEQIALNCNEAKVDFLFIGGSLMVSNQLENCISIFKKNSNIPVLLFPGSPSQVCKNADALLYLSLLSGRNPELLIGAHVVSAPIVKASGIEVIPTSYLVIDGGKATTVSYMSHSNPIPADKTDIAVCTAMAGEFQGKKLTYMDAGSGAKNAISNEMINAVSKNTNLPLIIGG